MSRVVGSCVCSSLVGSLYLAVLGVQSFCSALGAGPALWGCLGIMVAAPGERDIFGALIGRLWHVGSVFVPDDGFIVAVVFDALESAGEKFLADFSLRHNEVHGERCLFVLGAQVADGVLGGAVSVANVQVRRSGALALTNREAGGVGVAQRFA